MAQNKNGKEANETRNKGAEISEKIKASAQSAAVFFTRLGEHTVHNSKKLASFFRHNYHRFGKRPRTAGTFLLQKMVSQAESICAESKSGRHPSLCQNGTCC